MSPSLTTFTYTILIIISSLFYITQSYSACDEIDITFLIDASSIRSHPHLVRKFINAIILEGSSEYSGFAVAVYGYNVPSLTIKMHQYTEKDFVPKLPVIITVAETQNIAQRGKVEQGINSKLEQVFNIIDNPPSNAQMKNIPLMDAFIAATKQKIPKHVHSKKHKLKPPSSKEGVRRMMDDTEPNSATKGEDKKAYFIFDYWNRVFNKKDFGSLQPPFTIPKPKVGNSNDELCALFKHLQNNEINDKNEAIYYFLGFAFYKINVHCDGNVVKPPLINAETFNHFSPQMLQNKDLMEDIFDITCPADWEFPSGGKTKNALTLGNHNQFVDDKTIISCHLDNKKDPHILVKDIFNDDNTFGVNQFLLADPKTFEILKKMKCEAIMQITKIENKKMFESYQVLKLTIRSPESAMEYIRKCKGYGNIKLARVSDDKHGAPNEPISMNGIKRRLKEWNDEMNWDEFEEEAFLGGILSLIKDTASTAGNFIKNTVKNVGSVSKALGSVVTPGSVAAEKNLLNIHKKNDYKWKQQGELKDKKVAITDKGPNLVMNGKGEIELGVGYHVDVAVDLEYKMDWDLKNGLVEIQVVIYGYFDIGAYFDAKLNGEFDIKINDLLNIAPKFTFFLGPVPITAQPYVHLNARFKALDLKIEARLDCTYKEMFVLGYRIDSKAGPNPITTMIMDKHEYTMETIHKEQLKTLEECAKVMFKYGTGPHQQAVLCKYFDYNHDTRECRCKGAGDSPKLKPNAVSEAYVLGSECQVERKPSSTKRPGCAEIINSNTPQYICMACQRKHVDIKEEKMESKPIMDRKEITKECKKKLHTNNMDLYQEDKCQVTTLGFDVMIRPKVGIELMNLADVHLILQMDIPLRFEIPEMRPNICPSNKGDVCLTEPHLKASFSVSGVLSVSLGYGARLGPILRSLLSSFIKIGSLSQPTIKKLGEKKFDKTGCLEFKGTLVKMDEFFKKRCCGPNGAKPVNRVASQSILNEPLHKVATPYKNPQEGVVNEYKEKGIFKEYPMEIKKEWGSLIKKGVEGTTKKELFDMLVQSGPFFEFFKGLTGGSSTAEKTSEKTQEKVTTAGRQDIYNVIDDMIEYYEYGGYYIDDMSEVNRLGHDDYYKVRKSKIYKLKRKMIDRFF